MDSFSGKVAVVTGGAGGIGSALVGALLDEGARVVVSDVEKDAIDETVAGLKGRGDVEGFVTDVASYESVTALADHVFDRYGACHLLFNNAGVGAGGTAPPWEFTPNDWRWTINVNLLGPVWGVLAFVPRMLASGEEGHVINTSSGNGGVSPMADGSVYAASKAALTSFTETVAASFVEAGAPLKASVFYPSGGLLRTKLNRSARNRPAELAREKPWASEPPSWDEIQKQMRERYGGEAKEQDLDELARVVLQGIREGKFVLGIGIEGMGDTLARRAEVLRRGELPTRGAAG